MTNRITSTALRVRPRSAAGVLGLIVVAFVIRGAKERTVESVSAAA